MKLLSVGTYIIPGFSMCTQCKPDVFDMKYECFGGLSNEAN